MCPFATGNTDAVGLCKIGLQSKFGLAYVLAKAKHPRRVHSFGSSTGRMETSACEVAIVTPARCHRRWNPNQVDMSDTYLMNECQIRAPRPDP